MILHQLRSVVVQLPLPEARNFQVTSRDHVPNKFRLIGPLSNLDEFVKEFECQRGTRMNPIQKCQIY